MADEYVLACSCCAVIVQLGALILQACAGNLAFPLLLVGGLFLLSRRSQGGGLGGGPGGNNPFNFGKSKAKFSMEPSTGITFDDVAGVDEAKQDFMEVGACHLSSRGIAPSGLTRGGYV